MMTVWLLVIVACQVVTVIAESVYLGSMQFYGHAPRALDMLSHLSSWAGHMMLSMVLVLLAHGALRCPLDPIIVEAIMMMGCNWPTTTTTCTTECYNPLRSPRVDAGWTLFPARLKIDSLTMNGLILGAGPVHFPAASCCHLMPSCSLASATASPYSSTERIAERVDDTDRDCRADFRSQRKDLRYVKNPSADTTNTIPMH